MKASQAGVMDATFLSNFFLIRPEEAGKPWPVACFCKQSFIGTQPGTFLAVSAMAAFLLQQQS